MDINKLGDQLVICIAKGLANKYASVSNSLGRDGLYSYVLYCASGFNAMCIAVSTESSLKHVRNKIRESEREMLASQADHPGLLNQFTSSSDLYAELTACEWEYIYSDIPEFEQLDSLVSEIYEYSYEQADESFDVSHFLTDRVIEGINSFKTSSAFDSQLLTGLQFSDPSEIETKIVEKISSQTNQNRWHEKIVELHREQANS